MNADDEAESIFVSVGAYLIYFFVLPWLIGLIPFWLVS